MTVFIEPTDTFNQHVQDLFFTSVGLGFCPIESKQMVDKKINYYRSMARSQTEDGLNEVYRYLNTVKDSFKIVKRYPVNEINDKVGKFTIDTLWELGLDVKRYRPIFDYGVFSFNGKRMIGEYVVCEERRDKDWTNKRVNGYNVASFEVILDSHRDKTLLKELTGLS